MRTYKQLFIVGGNVKICFIYREITMIKKGIWYLENNHIFAPEFLILHRLKLQGIMTERTHISPALLLA